MLTLNQKLLMDTDQQVKYLHIVISSEMDNNESVSKEDILMIQKQFLDLMEQAGRDDTNIISKYENINQAGNNGFRHQTLFIPYYSEKKGSDLDIQMAEMATQLGQFSAI